ncbi:MAG TPA: hypothetical protein VHF22_08810, partial [Planctomycetota bacterium]|nr:hypothetical protein [Planctomycetota bacterium]
WTVAAAIVALNGWLTYATVADWAREAANPSLVLAFAVPVLAAIAGLLGYVTLAPIVTRLARPSLASIAGR